MASDARRRDNGRWLVPLGLIAMAGCVAVPPCTPPTCRITEQELSGHVQFLAGRDLAGRRPRSRGSAGARRYIAQHFEACGLVPWGQATGFDQPFRIGTNVIGVLPGSDPNLAQEFVVLSAHYDHLGPTKQGLCLGACDNASGVAGLLEIVERLSQGERRPRRSVCFASFDCEEMMLLGAMAFTCRPDYDPNRIAAVVNLDMLGRDGFEVLDHHLFVVGTEQYPDLRRQIQALAGDRIEVLPIGTDIAGPRGDHVVFESLGVPALFFTCSLYKDYHRPGDTADKLDYADLLGSAQVACETVRLLADCPDRVRPITPTCGDREELEALHQCLSRVAQDPNRLGLTGEEHQPIQKLVERIEKLLAQDAYSLENRRRLLWWHVGETVLPLMARFESPSGKPEPVDDKKPVATLNGTPVAVILQRSQFMAALEGREAMLDAGQAFMRHLEGVKHPLLLGMPTFEWVKSVLPDRYIRMEDLGEDRYSLVGAPLCAAMKHTQPPLWIAVFRPMSTEIVTSVQWFGFEGTRDELVDACLLCWGCVWKPAWTLSAPKVLCVITGTHEQRTYEQWLDRRLGQGPWPDEMTWIKDRARSSNPWVAEQALYRLWRMPATSEAESATCAILTDPNSQPRTRSQAIVYTRGRVGRQTLLALAHLVNDTTEPSSRGASLRDPFLGEFLGYTKGHDKKTEQAKDAPKPAPTTIGDLAHRKLNALTKKDFGKDEQAWVRWIERHYR